MSAHGNRDDDNDSEEEDKKMLQKHSEQRLAVLQGDDSVPEDDIEEASLPTLPITTVKSLFSRWTSRHLAPIFSNGEEISIFWKILQFLFVPEF